MLERFSVARPTRLGVPTHFVGGGFFCKTRDVEMLLDDCHVQFCSPLLTGWPQAPYFKEMTYIAELALFRVLV